MENNKSIEEKINKTRQIINEKKYELGKYNESENIFFYSILSGIIIEITIIAFVSSTEELLNGPAILFFIITILNIFNIGNSIFNLIKISEKKSLIINDCNKLIEILAASSTEKVEKVVD